MKTVRDPVCGMEVDPETGADQSQYQGLTYYFCSPDCHSKFNAHPENFAGEFGVDLREAARLSPSYPPSQGYGAASRRASLLFRKLWRTGRCGLKSLKALIGFNRLNLL